MIPISQPPPPSPTSTNTNSSWGPYSNSGDFTANALIILSGLFCSLIIILAIYFIIRYLFCGPSDSGEDKEKSPEAKTSISTSSTRVFSKEMLVAECAICLCEFVEEDGLRVLGPCNHGFHVECLEKWLTFRRSCPTCRRDCSGLV